MLERINYKLYIKDDECYSCAHIGICTLPNLKLLYYTSKNTRRKYSRSGTDPGDCRKCLCPRFYAYIVVTYLRLFVETSLYTSLNI